MCSKIVRNGDNIRVYRRYDVRKGKKPPVGSLPAGKNLKGEIEFYWLDVTHSKDPTDQYYSSALKKEGDNIVSVQLIFPSSEGFEYREILVNDLESGTYELVGPKVQGNRYQINDIPTSVAVSRKRSQTMDEVPQHYFIRHGAFFIDDIFAEQVKDLSLEELTKFITYHKIEGIVIHFSNEVSYKINRGHIGVELTVNDILKISINK